jgi:transposase
MDLWVEVRRYVLAEGHSKRSACKAFGINWRTMQKMVEHPEPPGYRRRATPRIKKIDPVLPILHQCLEDDRSAPRKQRHTSKRVYERLRDEHGFDGGQTIVKDAVRSWRKVHAQSYVPLSHPPGEAQVDFGEASGLPVSQVIQRRLEDVVVQVRIGQQLLEPGVLLLQLLEPLGLAGLHPPVLLTPAVVRRLAHAQRLQHPADRLARFEQTIRFLKLPDDLLRAVTNSFLA